MHVMNSYILASPIYDVFMSQLIRYRKFYFMLAKHTYKYFVL